MASLIRITARRDGFRRAGLAHPARPIEHPAEAFTAEQLAQLQAEPMLTVELVEAEPAEGKGRKAKAGKAENGEAS
jgi:hypothetical protein